MEEIDRSNKMNTKGKNIFMRVVVDPRVKDSQTSNINLSKKSIVNLFTVI